MTPRERRFWGAVAVLVGVGASVALMLNAFSDNLLFFYTPSQVLAGEVPLDQNVRVGGMVVTGSVDRNEQDLGVRFQVTDMQKTVTIAYEGILPDLFREGQGIIAQGRLDESGVLQASEVLAKHDENYMPPEVAASLAEQGSGPLAPVYAPTGGAEGSATVPGLKQAATP